MKLIQSDIDIRKYLPNILTDARGETPLIMKIEQYIATSERWIEAVFIGNETIETVCGMDDTSAVKQAAVSVVMFDAISRCLSSLDVVLTPNGIATVGTTNLSAASRARTERLMADVVKQRDNAISELIEALPIEIPEWLSSPMGHYYSETLFPTLSISAMLGENDKQWEKWLATRPQIVDIELALAEEFFSPELMVELRKKNLSKNLTNDESHVVRHIRSQVIACLRGEPIRMKQMVDLVNYIRLHPASFPVWHESSTAKLFSPPKFENKKKSGGYFF